jgi:hypothetical protein
VVLVTAAGVGDTLAGLPPPDWPEQAAINPSVSRTNATAARWELRK